MPLQIHQLWVGQHAKPDPWMNNVRDFAIYAGFAYKAWSEEEAQKDVPWDVVPGLRAAYDSLADPVAKSDVLRVLLLWKHGGVYVDSDVVVVNRERARAFFLDEEARGGLFASWVQFPESVVDEIKGKSDGREKLISNSVLGSVKPEHPFWKGYLELMVHRVKQEGDAPAWVMTGSLALTKLWEKLQEKVPEFEIYSFDKFYPKPMHNVKKTNGVLAHEAYIGDRAMFFQYGYGDNGFQNVFNNSAGMLGGASKVIPKHIHQVWLGKNPRPESWMKTVRDFAKDYGYEYTLWTDKEADEKLDWSAIPGLRRLYGGFHNQLAGRADIIRMLALYQYGGMYIDADSVILKPAKLDAFLRKNRAAVFFAWEELKKKDTKKITNFGPELKGATRLVANGVIGAAQKHPFFRKLLESVQGNAERERGEMAWRRVGPLHVSRIYALHKKEFPDVHVYPMKYFYPQHWRGIKDPEMHKKVRIPGKSMMFQYGYTTNGFDKIFRARARATRKRSKRAN